MDSMTLTKAVRDSLLERYREASVRYNRSLDEHGTREHGPQQRATVNQGQDESQDEPNSEPHREEDTAVEI